MTGLRVTAAEAAVVLGVHPSTITRWRQRGLVDYAERPPAGRRNVRGGQWLYDMDDLRAVHARLAAADTPQAGSGS